MENWNVFVSYSRLDRNIVAPIVQLLRIVDTAVFRDEDSIQPGKKWQVAIHESLNSCHTIVLFWSAAAAESKAVESEYQAAIGLRKDIVPVLLDDTPLIEELNQYQWIDFRAFVESGKERGIKNAIMVPTAVIGIVPIVGRIANAHIIYAIAKKASEGRILPEFSESEQASMKELLVARIVR